jgi:predicted transcriptional regulator
MKNQLTAPMSDLETKVMLVLWKQRACCVQLIKESLTVPKPMAYTTIQTLLERLIKKGYVIKHQAGNAAVYAPHITKQAYATQLITQLFRKLSQDFAEVTSPAINKSLEVLPHKNQLALKKLLFKSLS